MVKKVIIIGASSGIGEKLALYYAKTGCMVGIAARREDKLAAIVELYPHKMIYTLMDVTHTGPTGAVEKFVQLLERLGGV
ncbi:MAG: SDR family NAD(P)-dependent oxidoreductase, partial [Bacteroidales bacterium]